MLPQALASMENGRENVRDCCVVRMHMSTREHRFLLSALACLAVLTPGTVLADVHIGVGLGFGTVIGPWHPVHGWHVGWTAWPDPYWYDPWWYAWPVVVGPSVVVETPVVVREREVVVRERTPPAPRPSPGRTEQLSQRQQQRRNELLKTLRIGDVSNRLQAVQDLAPFAGSDVVRQPLERALLSDRDPQVRKAVAEMFGRLRSEKTLSALKQAYAEDADREVRQAAYRAILLMEGY